jgi:hypothetical protein
MDQIATIDWTQAYTIIGANIALLAVAVTIIIWMTNKLDGDIKSISNRMDGHAREVDQLYMMFCDLLKERK